MSDAIKTLPLLIRREFWEHRAFVFAPAVVAVIMIFAAIFAGTYMDLDIHAGRVPDPDWMEHRDVIIAVTLSGLSFPFGVVMCIVTFFYLLDSLYADRKDRSVLFWKSLPLSDSQTIAAKLITALVVLPLLTFAAVVVTNLVVALILSIRLSGFEQLDIWNVAWQPKIWLQVHGLMLYSLVFMALWYLPIVGWLMLASAWARRAVILWALLPPVLAIFLGKVLFNTWYVAELLADRLGGWSQYGGDLSRHAIEIDGDHVAWPRRMSEFIDPAAFFSSPGLWGGIAVAVLLLWATLLLRRRRNDA